MKNFCFLIFIILASFIQQDMIAQPYHSGHSYCQGQKFALSEKPLTSEDKLRIEASRLRSDSFDILDYHILADLTKANQKLFIGQCTVTFTPLIDNQDHIILDLEGLHVDSILNQNGEHLPFTHFGYFVKIQFPEFFAINDIYKLTVFYQGTPLNSDFGGFYLTDDYYYNLGIGIEDNPHNMGRAWFPCFDNFVERSTYTYQIKTTIDKRGFGLGSFISEDTIDSQYILREYRMMEQIPTYLSHIAASNYVTVDKMHSGMYGDIPIQLVVKPQNKGTVTTHFNVLGDALDCMEYWYGPYVWERVGYHMTGRGAMEHPTGVAYPINVALNGANRGLVMHELAHHWWGDLTTLSTDADMWFKEGPASYAEHQLTEWLDGSIKFENEVRRNNLTMLLTAHVQDGERLPLSPMPEDKTYGVHTYDKGAAMIHNLRAYLGDSLFRISMQHTLEQKSFSHVDANGFKELLEEASQVDLAPFFDNWIFSPGWSDFYIDGFESIETNGKYEVSVEIKQSKHYTPEFHRDVPLTLYIFGADGEEERRNVRASGEITDITEYVDFEPKSIHLNLRNELNLAQASDEYIIVDDNYLGSDYSYWRIIKNNFNDADIGSKVLTTHHFSAPTGTLEDINGRLSTSHFWHFSNPTGVEDLRVRLSYDGSRESALDFDLFGESEDSLLLVYQEIGGDTWTEYSDYSWNKINPFDKQGYVFINNPKNGKYALARGFSKVSNKENEVANINAYYPIPFTHELHIENRIDAEYYIIYDALGRIILKANYENSINTINTSTLQKGVYHIVSYKDGLDVETEKIMKF